MTGRVLRNLSICKQALQEVFLALLTFPCLIISIIAAGVIHLITPKNKRKSWHDNVKGGI